MQYFHRTSLPLDDVLAEADSFFRGRLETASVDKRKRTYSGSMGTIDITVRAEGGHYTLVTVATDRVGESEIDKLGKRFMALVHGRVDANHALRGSY